MSDQTIALLVERLRSMGSYGHKPYPTHFINPDGPEAATLIESLTTVTEDRVEQIDRDAAGRWGSLCCDMTMDRSDWEALEQAFAAHRIAAIHAFIGKERGIG